MRETRDEGLVASPAPRRGASRGPAHHHTAAAAAAARARAAPSLAGPGRAAASRADRGYAPRTRHRQRAASGPASAARDRAPQRSLVFAGWSMDGGVAVALAPMCTAPCGGIHVERVAAPQDAQWRRGQAGAEACPNT